MAISKTNKTFPLRHLKSIFLVALFIASSVTVVVFSQSGMAVNGPDLALSDDPAACGVATQDAKGVGHYSRTNFTASAAQFTRDNPLFWNSLGKGWLTTEQMSLLQMAYEIGFKDGGHEHAELLQAILMQETIAGLLGRMGHMTAPVGKRSYGVMQVKVTASRDVLNEYDEFGKFRADEELIVKLLSDDEFNIRIASKFLLQLSNRVGLTERALVAYNIGLRSSYRIDEPQSFKYVLHTKDNLEAVVRPFNQRFGGDTLRLATASQEASGS
ncbi:MAG: hypothetical protein U1B30_01390 [Pseudomonadota bacterium]|nr:hypothetical protein [Pseudomonadota bacterium]